MRARWPLTLRGTGAVLLGVACVVAANEIGVPVLLYFAVLLFVVVAVSSLSLYASRGTQEVLRSVSGDVAVGRTSTITAVVGVRSPIPAPPGTWSDTLSPALSGSPSGPFPALSSGLIGGERTVELSYAVTGVRRGVHTVGPLAVTSTDPFGFARRRHVIGATTSITIVPAVIDLPPLSSSAGEAGGSLRTAAHQLGQGADNLIARPYAPGDSMRRIHWRATAHRDQLMVRQEEQESTPEATVILDRGALRWASEATSPAGADPGFETAVSACVSVAARLAHEGYSVEIIDSDGSSLSDPLDGEGAIEHVLTDFATVTARRGDHLGALAALFSGAMTGPVVVIVGRFDAADAESLAPVAHHSTLPVLLSVAPIGDALERAQRSGWRVARLDSDTELAASWLSAVDSGAGHVAA